MYRQDIANAEYPSISDFLASLATCTNPVNDAVRQEYVETRDRADWYGADCRTGADVQKKMRDGWPEGRERMNELRASVGTIDIPPQDRRRRMVRADMGDILDIHSVYAGRLDIAWSTPRRQNTQGPQRIELCANMICSGAEHSDVLFWRGAAAAVLLDLLETAGYMVRLVVCFGGTVSSSNEKVSCRIIVKEHGTPFDITSTSATIMPGFFRALGHGWAAAHCKEETYSPSMSVHSGNVEPGEILLSHGIRDRGTALAFVNDTIARLNSGALAAA